MFLLFLVAFFTQKVAILIVIAALSIILLLWSIKYRNDFDITKEAFLTKEIIISHIRLQTKEDYRYSVGLSSLWTIAVLGIMWYSSSHKGNFALGIPVLLWVGIPTVLLSISSFPKFKRANYEISEILQRATQRLLSLYCRSQYGKQGKSRRKTSGLPGLLS